MTIELTKGERFNLSKESPDFNKIAIALGWQVSQTAQNYDIDASVFMLGADGRIPDEKYFVFYNNLTSPDGAVRHSGDSRNGQIEGDDETVFVDLSLIDAAVEEIVFVVTIHEGQANNQNFSQVTNAFIRLYNLKTGSELVRYNLKEVFSQETALEFGRLYKKNGEWRFQAVGQGYNAGLQSFVDKYHVENKVKSTENVAQKLDDAEVLRLFSDRVDKQLQAESVSSKAVESPAAIPVNAKLDDRELAISTEEFWQRYNAGERDFTGCNLFGVDLSEKTLVADVILSESNLTEANLKGATLKKVNLCGANLQKSNLSSTHLQEADLIGAKLSSANLTKAKLEYAKLIQANFHQAILSDANFTAANLTGANLSGANLTGANFSGANLTATNLNNANLTSANLNSANLAGADLSQANLNSASLIGTNLTGVKLTGVSFAGVDLMNVNLKVADLTGVSFVGANLKRANLRGLDLRGVNLVGVSLVGVNLDSVNLSGQNLSGFNLCGTSLIRVNLSQANLTLADLRGANLTMANLEKANLKEAKLAGANLTGANLEKAKLTGAIMPDGKTYK
ncbi:pentapeptide repeat-containing protein [Microcoleus sp. CAWBG58]|uniref:pentapeptide repeat-containing protein n=1 Tax=Microcoleus sp. CAWBG58 TaxID=2841651 RepID=UPI0025EB0E0A|nr:pentapeptide repeat-containing protein [Microcoleus sp. CAWBG58]